MLRRIAETLLDESGTVVADLESAVLAALAEPMRADPALVAEAAASTRANVLHWATTTLREPGARVPVHLGPEVLGIAREALRRGAENALLGAYHAGQNVAWRHVMRVAFRLSADVTELQEALSVAARSIFAFVDDTLVALHAQLEHERNELTRGTHAERFEVATLILEGAPISVERASSRLGYDLRYRHAAVVVWDDPRTADQTELTRAAEAAARACGADHRLTVIATASSLWLWCAAAGEVDPNAVREAIRDIPRVRVALGPARAGVDGFRRSHLDAVTTQRLMRHMPADLRVASFADVQLVALTAHDGKQAAEFVARTLGELASADPELRQTLRVYIREQFSAARAARVLFTHRNTVLNRLQRAERLLPVPLRENSIEVGVALEMAHWLGTGLTGQPE